LNPTEVLQVVIPTEERSDLSCCRPDRESVANEWRDPFDSQSSLRTSLWGTALGGALSAFICVICGFSFGRVGGWEFKI
jgi:hypothetical protein